VLKPKSGAHVPQSSTGSSAWVDLTAAEPCPSAAEYQCSSINAAAGATINQ
jgi:hypothetical protein